MLIARYLGEIKCKKRNFGIAILKQCIMKSTIRIFGIALVLLVVNLPIGCSDSSDDNTAINPTAYKVPPAPTGNTEQYLRSGATLSDIAVTGENIRWYYANPNTYTDNPSNNSNEADRNQPTNSSSGDSFNHIPALPMSLVLENENVYYATQTKNGIESHSALSVTVYLK